MVTSNQTRALGLFSNREDAEQALTELKSSGFPMDKVSVVARDAGEAVGERIEQDDGEHRHARDEEDQAVPALLPARHVATSCSSPFPS